MDKPIDPELIDAIRKKECVLIIGKDISIMSGLPPMQELLQNPAKEIGIDAKLMTEQEIAEYYIKSHPKGAGILKKQIKKWLEAKNGYKDNHLLIKDLPFQVIITTNYDLLLEQAYDTLPKTNYNRIVIEDGLNQWDDNTTQIIKILGTIDQVDKIIIASSEYANFTESYPNIIQKIKSLSVEKTFLFLGFSKNYHELGWMLKILGWEKGKIGKPPFIIMTNKKHIEYEDLEKIGFRILELSSGEEISPFELSRFLRELSNQVKGYSYSPKEGENSKPVISPLATVADHEKQNIIDRLINTRLGSYLSLRVDPKAVDNAHHYQFLKREDLLDYSVGDFYSIRTLHGVNISEGLSTGVIYSESTEVKVTFDACGIKAMDVDTGEPLDVEPLENGRNELRFTQIFKILFPFPIAPSEQFKIAYSIRLPGELKALSQRGDAMSISLARILHGVDLLQFDVVLDKRPSNYWVEELNYEQGRVIVPLRPTLEKVDKDYQMTWSGGNPYRLSCQWEKPKAIAYFINYRFT